FAPSFLLIGLILFLFPHGRPPSGRWWLVAWVILAFGALQTVGAMLRPGHLPYSLPSGVLENPAGLEPARGVLEPLAYASGSAGMALFVVGAAAVLVRYRRSSGVERQQIKWVVAAGWLFVMTFFALLLAGAVIGWSDPFVHAMAVGVVLAL